MELFSEKIFNKSKGKTLLPYICDICGKYDVRTKRGFQYGYKNGTKHQCCSKKCSHSIHSKDDVCVDVNCAECGKKFTKYSKEVKRSNNNFCSKSCAAKYNNKIYIKRAKNEVAVDYINTHKPMTRPKIRKVGKVSKNKKKYHKLCISCNNNYYAFRENSKYCSLKCQNDYQRAEKLRMWKSGEIEGWSGQTYQLLKPIRDYIVNKYNYRCSKCGWDEIHPITRKVPIEINHIDGDAKNCKEDNLEVLCPNCHSLTYNYRALNKNSCRKRK